MNFISERKLKSSNLRVIQLLSAVLFISACQAQPQPIKFGSDQCALCKMEIADQRFGAEIVTVKGKVYKYDSGECLVNFIRQQKIPAESIKQRLVINAAKPTVLIDADKAYYLHSEHFPSPMGGDLSAFETRAELHKFQSEYPGEVWDWNDVMKNVR